MSSENMEKKVTSISTLKGYMKGSLVRLPDFGPGQEFYARLTRPSMLEMIKRGEIPNAVLSSASDLFAEGATSFITNRDKTKELFDVIDVLCNATFVEPSYQDLKDAGIKLTDEQMMYIFSYTQNGVDALQSFREEREGDVVNTDVTDVQGEAE